MAEVKDLFQSADWKKEKHCPIIVAPDKIKPGGSIKISVSVGREIPQPNTTDHHIRWIEVYFLPDGENFPYDLARFEFNAHGESAQGPNTSTVLSNPEVSTSFKSDKSGTILAFSYCNIHGLWQSSKKIEII